MNPKVLIKQNRSVLAKFYSLYFSSDDKLSIAMYITAAPNKLVIGYVG